MYELPANDPGVFHSILQSIFPSRNCRRPGHVIPASKMRSTIEFSLEGECLGQVAGIVDLRISNLNARLRELCARGKIISAHSFARKLQIALAIGARNAFRSSKYSPKWSPFMLIYFQPRANGEISWMHLGDEGITQLIADCYFRDHDLDFCSCRILLRVRCVG